jgi:hypothetical protein
MKKNSKKKAFTELLKLMGASRGKLAYGTMD